MDSVDRLAAPLLVRSLLYLAINTLHPLLCDFLAKHGGIPVRTMVHVLPIYAGMIFIYILPHPVERKPLRDEKWWLAGLVGLLDLAHQLVEKVGLVMTGSALYILLSSSGIIWTSFFSYIFVKKPIHRLMGVGVALTFMGLLTRSFTHDSPSVAMQNQIWLGTICTLAGSMMQSITYVLTELFLTSTDNAFQGPNFVFIHGVANTSILGLWFLYTCGLPGSEEWKYHFTDKIEAAGGNSYMVLGGYLTILFIAIIRSNVLWYIQQHGGAVTVNILKGARAGIVVLLSHILFCHVSSNQCLTPMKLLSAAMCIGGVFVYGIGKRTQRLEGLQGPKKRSDIIIRKKEKNEIGSPVSPLWL